MSNMEDKYKPFEEQLDLGLDCVANRDMTKAVYWLELAFNNEKASLEQRAEAAFPLHGIYLHEPSIPRDTVKAERYREFAARHHRLENYRNMLGGNTSTSTGKVGGCYIATCVYGSYDCPEVLILRRFRDNTLVKKRLGRLFIRIYYFISPKLVKMFGNAKWFVAVSRLFVHKLVEKLR